MDIISYGSGKEIETNVILRPNNRLRLVTEWAPLAIKYSGSSSADAKSLRWLSFLKYVSENDFTEKFIVPDIIDVDFNRAVREQEIRYILSGLLTKSTYKKYSSIWSWIPPLQDILLDTDWYKKTTNRKPLLSRRSTRSRPGSWAGIEERSDSPSQEHRSELQNFLLSRATGIRTTLHPLSSWQIVSSVTVNDGVVRSEPPTTIPEVGTQTETFRMLDAIDLIDE